MEGIGEQTDYATSQNASYQHYVRITVQFCNNTINSIIMTGRIDNDGVKLRTSRDIYLR